MPSQESSAAVSLFRKNTFQFAVQQQWFGLIGLHVAVLVAEILGSHHILRKKAIANLIFMSLWKFNQNIFKLQY